MDDVRLTGEDDHKIVQNLTWHVVTFDVCIFYADVLWPSSDPIILNTANIWTETVRPPNTVAKDLLSRMITMLKGWLSFL